MAHKADDGLVYYFNTLTNESRWDPPPGWSEDMAAKVDKEPVPVSSEPVPDTVWSEVKCEDERVYYFNTETEEASWTVPPEVATVKAKLAEEKEKREAAERAERAAAAEETRRKQFAQVMAQRQRMNNTGGFGVHGQVIRAGAGGHGAYGRGQGNVRSALAVAERAGAERARQANIQRFKELLMDKGVTPFSRWERELPKLESDPRYKLLPNLKERRAAFDDFCKNVAAEQKALKESRAQRVKNAFMDLLEEAVELEVRLLTASREEAHAKQAEKEDGMVEMEIEDQGKQLFPSREPIERC
ncbi:hypothetical protein DUNSADRAFT_8306 [Dunaliella salina]|uniref:WW domain-containing protein n=1 Tax=Dunaliella salina TaxID=3046 RepID=A0ABQ7H5V1_DUNSA|nr:hypothetical protein DUNSADRAFT_8306 [Dunaliella salina]|eukprot:KAF5842244.1 hypothetical protein DUNSADRAFT_8306 [Dunaliella salina]